MLHGKLTALEKGATMSPIAAYGRRPGITKIRGSTTAKRQVAKAADAG
jgi:hypothetical protein